MCWRCAWPGGKEEGGREGGTEGGREEKGEEEDMTCKVRAQSDKETMDELTGIGCVGFMVDLFLCPLLALPPSLPSNLSLLQTNEKA